MDKTNTTNKQHSHNALNKRLNAHTHTHTVKTATPATLALLCSWLDMLFQLYIFESYGRFCGSMGGLAYTYIYIYVCVHVCIWTEENKFVNFCSYATVSVYTHMYIHAYTNAAISNDCNHLSLPLPSAPEAWSEL